MTRVVLFEDDARYRAGLETLLRHAPDLECVAAFARLEPGMKAAATAAADWDLVLMDLDLPDGSGLDGIRGLKGLRPALPVVALTVFEEPRTVLQAICAGAVGYLLKRSSAREVSAAIRSAVDGGAPLTPAVASTVLDFVRRGGAAGPAPTRLELTTRERDVLRELARGASYQGAGEALGLTVETVRSYVRGLYKKLQVHSVGQAVAMAIREGLV